MFLTPDQFIAKYKKDQYPYFKIYKGNSRSEAACIGRFMENPEGLEGYDLLNKGEDELDYFFTMFDDGNVTIVTKSSPSSKDSSSNSINVRWGNAAAYPNSRHNRQNTRTSGMDEMKKMQQTFEFFGGIFKSQLEAQHAVLKANYDNKLAIMEKEREHKAQIEELMAEYMQPEPSIGQILQGELAGLIRPAAEFFMAKNGMQVPAQHLPATVNGMEKTEGGEGTDTEARPKAPAVDTGKSPMHGASMDHILMCVRQMAEQVFPEYPINESLPALVAKCIEQKALIRSQVEPIILANRQAANKKAQ